MAEREPLISDDTEITDLRDTEPGSNIQYVPTETQLKKRGVLKGLFIFANIASNLGLYASTPIYTSVMSNVSDIYCLLIVVGFLNAVILAVAWLVQQLFVLRQPIYLFCKTPWKTLILCGFLSTIQNIVVVFATLPSRVPSFLYPLITPTIIPFTAFVRYLMTKKSITIRQIICCIFVVLGVFISAVPTIFSLPLRDDQENSTHPNSTTDWIIQIGQSSAWNHIQWPLFMILAQIPAAVNYVIYEKGAQLLTKELLLFYFWAQFMGFLWLFPLFWLDVIPKFGQALSLTDFGDKFKEALVCHFWPTLDPSNSGCKKVPLVFVMNSISYVGADVFLICLMAVSEGSVFSTLISSLSLPLSSFFWILFKYEETSLSLLWDPIINYTVIFPIIGLFVLIPSTILFEKAPPFVQY